MKNSKNLIKIVLSVVTGAMILTACSNKQVTDKGNNDSTSETTMNKMTESDEDVMKEKDDELNTSTDSKEISESKDEISVSKDNTNLYKTPIGFDTQKKDVEYGEITTIEYDSKTTGVKRKANIILPAKYDENKQYPVLYLFHGIGGDENEWRYGNPQYVIGNLIASGEAEEMIVVIPNCRARENDAVPKEDMFSLPHFQAFDNFINDLNNDLMPYIKEHYSVAEGRENTAIAGLSMGGRESLNIGFKMPETFGYIGAFCPAFGIFGYTNNAVTEEGLFTEDTFTIPDTYKTFIMIVKGKSDNVVNDEPEKYHNVLVKNKVEHIYYEAVGGHDFTVWKNGLYNFAKELFHK